MGQSMMGLLTGGIYFDDEAQAPGLKKPVARESFLKIEVVMLRVAMSKSQVYQLVAEGRFPAPVHAASRCSYWIESEIDQWIQAHIDEERAGAARKPLAVRVAIRRPPTSSPIHRLPILK